MTRAGANLHSNLSAALLLALLLGACVPVLKGNGDLRLRELIVAPDTSANAIVPLLAKDVEVHRPGGTVKGISAGAAALAALKPGGGTQILRHHHVSLVQLGDGRVLLVERNGEDLITRAVELRAPSVGDALPRRLYYYGAAWNTDPAKARLALVEASYAKDGYYVDPGHEVRGTDEVSQMLGNLRFVAPGSRLKFTSGVADAGDGWVTDDWVMVSRLGGRTLFTGFDIMHLDADGKIDFLAGFIGKRSPD